MRTLSITTGLLASAALTTLAQAQTATQQVCVDTSGLALIVPAGTICRPTDFLVSWLTTGPQGLQGAAGAAGAAGPVGAQGAAGVAGARGSRGAAGAAGPVGPAGPAGAPGAAGPTGSAGAVGPVGPAGSQGAPGAAGPTGSAGPVGATGASGASGAPGPAGIAGLVGPAGGAGPTGPAGPAGPAGPTAIGPTGNRGGTGPAGATGPTGPQGPAGTQTLFGIDTNRAAAGRSDCVMGSVWLSAGAVAGGLLASGQTLSIAENGALFSLLGTAYGGDGQTTFNLPDLRSKAPNGLSYWICDIGIYPSRL